MYIMKIDFVESEGQAVHNKVQTYDYVNGALWTVSDTTQTLSEQIADQVGGRAVHVDCSDVEMPSG